MDSRRLTGVSGEQERQRDRYIKSHTSVREIENRVFPIVFFNSHNDLRSGHWPVVTTVILLWCSQITPATLLNELKSNPSETNRRFSAWKVSTNKDNKRFWWILRWFCRLAALKVSIFKWFGDLFEPNECDFFQNLLSKTGIKKRNVD